MFTSSPPQVFLAFLAEMVAMEPKERKDNLVGEKQDEICDVEKECVSLLFSNVRKWMYRGVVTQLHLHVRNEQSFLLFCR